MDYVAFYIDLIGNAVLLAAPFVLSFLFGYFGYLAMRFLHAAV